MPSAKTCNMKITKVARKSLIIRPSGRSTDFISPSFGHGCLYDCSYCYMKRHKPTDLTIATNTDDILTAIDHHVWFDTTTKPNQTHKEFITYDISCNEDFALHAKHHKWKKIFNFFKNHPLAMGSFATKYVNESLLDYNPEGKIRIRFSLMPQVYADKLEPNTSLISDRIKAIDRFIDAGYDVHINFSPVIVEEGWLDEYEKLFNEVNSTVKNKDKVKAEVIFLTHNQGKHEYNLANGLSGEELLWKPEIQETKTSQYGGENIRYKHDLKAEYIKQWTALHDQIIRWNTVRYIF
jgi:spore photoproduct lyase